MKKRIATLILVLFPLVCFGGEAIIPDLGDESTPIIKQELDNLNIGQQVKQDNELDMKNRTIENVADPTTALQGTNKQYVDNATTAINLTVDDIQYKVKLNNTDTGDYLANKTNCSIVNDGYKLHLDKDKDNPGNNYVYGTNVTGAKGWKPDPLGMSNLAYLFAGSDKANAAAGFCLGVLNNTPTVLPAYWVAKGAGALVAIRSQWKKLPGINNITNWAYMNSSNNGLAASCYVDVGGYAVTLSTPSSHATPQWVVGNVTVSGLVDNTTYNMTVSLYNADAGEATALYYLTGINIQ